jgi:N-acetyl sugar amidotransferase
MDTTDAAIRFDGSGVCDHCRDFNNSIEPNWHTDVRGHAALSRTIDEVRKAGKGQDFDCILGLSGGLDSSYMLHLLVKEYGLRPLVFHVDGGWNSDLAVNNIQMLVEKLGLDLFTEVIDWEDMRDFQLAFFKSGISQIDIPQDHAFVATLYKFANKYGVKHIMNGGNISTECVRNPLEWLYYGTDMWLINDIRKQFCTRPLANYPFSSVLFHKFYLRYIRRVQVVRPLNYMPYSKELAINTLRDEYGWRAYPQKHFESRFTKFFEGYWLPTRFGYDTRKVQFSSLILTGQMTREEALEKLKVPAYDPATIDDEFAYIAKKLGISVDELRLYHTMPLKSYKDYRNQEALFNAGAKVLRAVGIERSIKR